LALQLNVEFFESDETLEEVRSIKVSIAIERRSFKISNAIENGIIKGDLFEVRIAKISTVVEP